MYSYIDANFLVELAQYKKLKQPQKYIFTSISGLFVLRKEERNKQILMQFFVCSFSGLETWSNLTKLEILDISYNFLDGSIIYDLAAVPSLRTLDLSGNNIDSSSLPINGNKIKLINDLFSVHPIL